MSKVIFMGTPDFAAGILRALLDSEHEILAVFTQPDRPKGRKSILQPPPVKELALEHGLPVFQPERIRKGDSAETIRKLEPDFIVTAAFGQIIPQEILDIPRYCCLNVHASLLPAWRGAAPIQWSILSGDKESGITIMRMDAGLDTGDIVDQVVIPISENETGGSLFDKCMNAGADQILKSMKSIELGEAVFRPQSAESTTPYAKMLERKSGLIDWSRSAEEIERMVRGLDPWPCAFSYEKGRMIKLWSARAEKGGSEGGPDDGRGALPGTVLTARGGSMRVQTGRGVLSVLEIQPEGRRRMGTGDYLRGARLEEGTVLGQ